MQTLRLKQNEQNWLRKKIKEINILREQNGQEPIRASEYLHQIIEGHMSGLTDKSPGVTRTRTMEDVQQGGAE